MKNYGSSDYWLNKNAKGIVYRFANDVYVEVTLENYLAENPDKTAEHFAAWKKLSDADYLADEKEENKQTFKDVNLEWADKAGKCSEKSYEETIVDAIDAREEKVRHAKRVALTKTALDKLTETQRRRYLLYAVKGLSTWEIAEKEGVNQKTIYESLQASEKKIKKVLKNS